MSHNIIQKLKSASPKKRGKILLRMRRKNRDFFERTAGCHKFAELLKNSDVREYEIKITEDFLDIIEKKTGLYCHPPGDLLGQVDRLASPYHSDWQTIINPLHSDFGESEHGELVRKFIERLYLRCPDIKTRRLKGDLTLPAGENGMLHCGPVVFFGIFHGLHILTFLKKVSPSHIILLEPDVESFLLSCYFVDYEYLGKKFASLSLDVGGGISDRVLENFFDTVSISSRVWVRFLPVYRAPEFGKIIEKFRLQWAKFEIYVAFGDELRGLVAGASNLRKGHRYCPHAPLPLSCANVAVVGSGPSLKEDLEWLRRNQDNLLIVTATSSGLLLSNNNIAPDIHTFLEVTKYEALAKYLLNCPTIVYYKVGPEFVDRLAAPILYAEGGRHNIVRFANPLWNTHPTSANLAMKIACLLRPKNLYLIGLDLSMRDAEDGRHAAQVLDKSLKSVFYGDRTAVAVEKANFPESDGILKTNSYFWYAKKSLEDNIRDLGEETAVYNLSDGIFIEGAKPVRSGEISPAGPGKPAAAEVLNAFPEIAAADWEVYPEKGQDKLAAMKEEILALFGQPFVWDDFVKNIDLKLPATILRQCNPAANDSRMEVYAQLIYDMATEWYRGLIYTETVAEAEVLYADGIEALKEVLQELYWPEELDAL